MKLKSKKTKIIKDDSKRGDKSDQNLENVEILGNRGNRISKLIILVS